MNSDRFSLCFNGLIYQGDSRFPVLLPEFSLSAVTIPDINLKRKYNPNIRSFNLEKTLPIVQFMCHRFEDGTDLETACWDADFITHRVALSGIVADAFKLSVEVFEGRVFMRLREKTFFGVQPKTEEQKNISTYTVAFLTNSDMQPEWRHYVLRRMKIGRHKVYFNALIDAKKKTGELIEITSRRGYDLSRKSAESFWVENYLSGIETTVIGYHDGTGKMTKVEQIKDNKTLVKRCHLKKENFDEKMIKIRAVLDIIEDYCIDNPDVKRFDVIKISDKAGIKVVRIDDNDENNFLDEDFKMKYSSV